ncbi:MAG: hypothetical protein AB1505_17895 [Candidatus Latescibacterota bacterium]
MLGPVDGTPLVVVGEREGSEWTVIAANLAAIRDLLGLPLLIEFCRCNVAADRLLSLGDFTSFNDRWTPREEIQHARNLQTMFWFACGTLHEAIHALNRMEQLGVEGLLASFDARKPWIELRTTVARWSSDPIYQRVRNRIAFHIDGNAIRRGINKPERADGTVVWKKGNSRWERTTIFSFAQDCLLAEFFPEEMSEDQSRKAFGEFAKRVRDTHLHFSEWIHDLFIAALRGAGLGLKCTPARPPAQEGLSRARLEEIDPTVLAVSRRQDEEERRLRAIAATAKEYLETKAPAAERRLRELLDSSVR